MEVSQIASLATDMNANQLNQAVGLSVMKKAMNMASANAAQLIAALPAPQSSAARLPSHLGQNINTSA